MNVQNSPFQEESSLSTGVVNPSSYSSYIGPELVKAVFCFGFCVVNTQASPATQVKLGTSAVGTLSLFKGCQNDICRGPKLHPDPYYVLQI